MNNIAAILTVHNRKAKTLDCLTSLFAIAPAIDVYLTDDASTDGTAVAIVKKFPTVHVIHGNGNLFWTRGMNLAWQEALKGNYQYYLWLNDDVRLYSHMLRELMECETIGGGGCVVCGLVENLDQSSIIYGGRNRSGELIQPSAQPQDVVMMNGNVVLVPHSVIEQIGIMDSHYHHDLGDVDYALTARENGIKVLSTRCAVAAGYPNGLCRVRKWNATLQERFRKLNSPLGSPLAINFYFRKKHFGLLSAILFNIRLILLNILPDRIVKMLWEDKYMDKTY